MFQLGIDRQVSFSVKSVKVLKVILNFEKKSFLGWRCSEKGLTLCFNKANNISV